MKLWVLIVRKSSPSQDKNALTIGLSDKITELPVILLTYIHTYIHIRLLHRMTERIRTFPDQNTSKKYE